MTTTLKSGPKARRSTKREKNGRRISLISHATALTHTWATPKNVYPEVKSL
jgi:hypothetical protein